MKWSIIGAGNISDIFCENLYKQKTSDIISISSIDKIRLKNFGNKFNIDENYWFNNYNDVTKIKDDIVYIGVINSLHKNLIKNLAESNKNILVEKPSFLSVKDFDDVVKVIKEKKILFVESMMNLHHPQTSEVFNLIKSGEIGDLINFKHKFGFDIRKKFLKFFRKNINFYNRLTDPNLGGGSINDLGCYGVSFANKLANLKGLDNVIKVKKENIIGKTNVDENAKLSISYDNDFHANLEVSFIKNIGCEAVIEGTKGKIIVPDLVKPQDNFKIILKNKTSKVLNFKAGNLYSYIATDVERYVKNNLKEADSIGLNLSEIRKNLILLDEWKKIN